MILNKLRRAWVPLERLGPFQFGENLEPTPMGLQRVEDECDDFWESYKEVDNDDLRVYSENGKIICVGVDEYFFYRGKNCIGIPFEEFLAEMKAPYNYSETQDVLEESQDVFRFDSLGLIVWVKDGIIVTIQCSGEGDSSGASS